MTGLVGGCAMTAKQIAYRDRLELGFVTPEDIERFKTSPEAQLALTSDARSLLPRYAQAQDLELMKAAVEGDVARIKTLLASGAQVNAIDEWGNSALLMAAREGQVESVRMLLKAGAEVDGFGGAMSPLAASALRGHAILVRLLIRNGANVNVVGENEQTALMNAVKLNRLEVVPALIEAGANTKVIDRNGDNLLVVAVSQNYPAMLSLLLKLGVSPDMSDRNGLTALYWAEYLNRPALAQLLRDAGADPVHKKTQIIVSQPYNFGEF
jgi:ankyrin repeat protein